MQDGDAASEFVSNKGGEVSLKRFRSGYIIVGHEWLEKWI